MFQRFKPSPSPIYLFIDAGQVSRYEGIRCMEFYEAIKSPLNPVTISHPLILLYHGSYEAIQYCCHCLWIPSQLEDMKILGVRSSMKPSYRPLFFL